MNGIEGNVINMMENKLKKAYDIKEVPDIVKCHKCPISQICKHNRSDMSGWLVAREGTKLSVVEWNTAVTYIYAMNIVTDKCTLVKLYRKDEA